MKFKTLFFACILGFYSMAQDANEVIKINDFYTSINTEINNNNLLIIQNQNLKFTSLIIETENKYNDEIKILYQLKQGEEKELVSEITETENGLKNTYSTGLHVFGQVQKTLKINFGNYKGKVKISLLCAPQISEESTKKLQKTTNKCDKPEMISYTLWRQGLPAPKPPREKTKVEHLVIHHSAGSNSDTDYINTVRNIYLLHTQSNGWDDIGYNFLIAPNGVIFNGRDPQGVDDDDNILGAHFCGKNQNTMGICFMGNFMTKKPSEQALFSLNYLLAWKLKKDHINAFGQTIHPHPSGNLLNNICGHRDGCSTSCPGDSLYMVLNDIRYEAARIADSCGLVLDKNEFREDNSFYIYPNPSYGEVYFKSERNLKNSSFLLFNSTGKLVAQRNITNNENFLLSLPEGIYFYKIINNRFESAKGILSIIK